MNNNINPMQILGMIKNGGSNPQQMVLSMLQSQAKGNPVFENLLTLAQKGNSRGIEGVVRNILKEQGFDFDTEFQNFKNNLGL